MKLKVAAEASAEPSTTPGKGAFNAKAITATPRPTIR